MQAEDLPAAATTQRAFFNLNGSRGHHKDEKKATVMSVCA